MYANGVGRWSVEAGDVSHNTSPRGETPGLSKYTVTTICTSYGRRRRCWITIMIHHTPDKDASRKSGECNHIEFMVDVFDAE